MSLPVLESRPCGDACRCNPPADAVLCPWCGVRGGHEPLCLGSHTVAGPLRFDGETYEPELDEERLGAQFLAVRRVMLDGRWRTLSELASEAGCPEASASARLRDLRKERFGGHTVARRRRGDGKRGIFEYRVEVQS